jgi:hypothetical protein
VQIYNEYRYSQVKFIKSFISGSWLTALKLGTFIIYNKMKATIVKFDKSAKAV